MVVPMMQVRIVRVLVAQGRVVVPVDVRFPRRIVRPVDVLVMVVVDVPVLMLEGLVGVLVIVAFRQVQIEPGGHEDRRGDQRHGHRLAEKR